MSARRFSMAASSRKSGPGASTAIRLPAAASAWTRSNSNSWAAAGRNGSRPSADQALGSEASKPACRNAAGQSWRKSTGTCTRLQVGSAPFSRSVDDLNSSTLGWSSS